ncbi:hypothetical protein Fcan01_00136 [Folsomia candida]|uniref:Uncharacterized protein n=1 Tax=Folsomia candida TaxID=158441 RepID=A0A226F174_FOLCA|nr:hypothetical protein Fcan01_00136 [Folsomia candida]
MTTDQLWQGFANFAEFFPFGEMFPIRLNPKRRVMFCNVKRKVRISVGMASVNFIGQAVAPGYLLFFRDFPSAGDNYSAIMVIFGMALICQTFTTFAYLVVWMNCKETVKGFNSIVQMEVEFFNVNSKNSSIPVILLSYLFRLPLITYGCVEIVTMASFLVICFIITLEIYGKILREFYQLREKITWERGNVRLRTLYIALSFGIELFAGFQGPTTAALMAIRESLIVICSIATIRMWRVIPMPLYLIFPTISLVIPILALNLLPKAAHCYDRSVKLLQTWRNVASLDDGILRRRLRGRGTLGSRAHKRATAALRPIKIYATVLGTRLFMAKKSTKGSFLYSCLDATMSGLVTFNNA